MSAPPLCPPLGRPRQTHRPRRSRGPSVLPAGCRFAPTPGSDCSSGRCAPRPESTPRLACRVLAPPGLALIAIPALRKRRLRRRIGLRVARTRCRSVCRTARRPDLRISGEDPSSRHPVGQLSTPDFLHVPTFSLLPEINYSQLIQRRFERVPAFENGCERVPQ